jgi:hypothetical protein
VVKSGGNVLPADLAGTLNKDLASTAGMLDGNAQHMLGQASSQGTAVLNDAAKALQQPTKGTAENAQKALGGLKPTSLPALPTLK